MASPSNASPAARKQLTPSADHPITVTPSTTRVVVRANGHVIADTRNALTLREASYPPVQYIPREDVEMSRLVRTEHQTYCPYKGDASYYSIADLGEAGENAIWTYETPFDAVKSIANYVAFYPNRVDIDASEPLGN
ncbi:hypothetical protein PPN31114_00156 [Pandoraea pneumonica]|jgi:uncharacterized protein (DUF427 family)|uniref:DUF427 domain-containing protein n=1 Tax=Pandoraea pneumonica TaxID=2508299 RepID=A0A5E4RG37_9BURK|nr:DUF427 domain-containing protein [Pandoraea pneumonica]VVD62167.1 hypothetical protein PPN31114_00156 [Pandoraea pneumonica]